MRVRGFRNLQPLAFEPGSHFNVIHGDNGAGKSNLLEAIYYLGALKSFRGAKTDDLIGLESDNASLEATLEGGPAANKLRIDIGRSQRRRLQLDGKRPRSTSVWHQAVRMVL
ncbi:MAG: AAA family ATPase [Deltaproteobacteria bacterium]|nr:AAA family ATPase [Deltaproteobacteria bacterium]